MSRRKRGEYYFSTRLFAVKECTNRMQILVTTKLVTENGMQYCAYVKMP